MIGVDIVYLARFKRLLEGKNGERLFRRIFTDDELRQCEGKIGNARMRSMAGRFAVKEAVIKASKGELGLADLKSIEIRQCDCGAIDVYGARDDVTCRHYEASISHDGDYVIGVSIKADH